MKLSPIKRIKTVNKAEFLRDYKTANKPVVIEQLTKDWPARTKWSSDYLKQVSGDSIVPLYDCVPSTNRKHQHAPAAKMSLAEYIDRLDQGKEDLRLFFYNILSGAPKLINDFSYPNIGLKFFKKLPVLFMAAKGTKVQMHFDIDWADIFLCHFGGKKRVILFPPDQTKYLYHVPFSFSSLFDVDFDTPDYEKYPALKYIKGEEVELQHGDVLYIPPGYWHYIVYKEFSLSMALRAFPRTPKNLFRLVKNILFIRTVEGLMRKLIGQSWNQRNERLAVSRTHQNIQQDFMS